MTLEGNSAFQREAEFLSAIEVNLESAKGKQLRGTIWERSSADESDRLRALLASNGRPDRELLKTLPANRRVMIRGFERRWGFWRKATGVAVASVLSPLPHFAAASGQTAPPIDLPELTNHVRQLVGDARTPHILGICSPTGFTDAARQARLGGPNTTVVLIEPAGADGWRVVAGSENVDSRLLRIFDPEGAKQKLERVRREVESQSADLLSGGLSVADLASRMGLPPEVVRQGFEALVVEDRELRLMRHDGEFVLYRGAPLGEQEKTSMSVIDRIRQLFSRSGDEVAKINLLTERRAALARRRDRMYEDIAKLEQREAELLQQGKAATSPVPRRRIAAQLAQLRKDIARHNTTAAMLNQQINILSTNVHNLTLIKQGELAQLPSSEELTETAVQAEELLESLKADADLVGELATGMEASVVSDEEQAILREFEAGTAQSAGPAKAAAVRSPQPAAPVRAPEKSSPVREPERPRSVESQDLGAGRESAPPGAEERTPKRDAEKN